MFNLVKNKIKNYLRIDTIDKLLEGQSKITDELLAISSVLRQDEKYNKLFWLYDNKEERMDATKLIFNESRRLFHLSRYEFASNYCSGKNVADIACGTGYGTKLLAIKGEATSVIGIDICTEAIAYATNEHSLPCVTYRKSSGTETGLESGTIDIIVSFETIEHISNDHDLIKEFYRILIPGGLLVCSTPNKWPIAIASHHVREYDRSSFITLLSSLFEIVGLYNQNSGDSSPFNRAQEKGIVETSDDNFLLAECFIAVCKKKMSMF